MACENDKCESYGMHHEYKNGVEVKKCQFCERDFQPERLNKLGQLHGNSEHLICESLNSGNK